MKIIDNIGNLFNKLKAKFGAHNIERTPAPPEPPKQNSYQHQEVLNQLLKTIGSCPMDSRLKTILRMRIWGPKPDVFCPLDCRHVAAALKIRSPETMEARNLVLAIGEAVKTVTAREEKDVKRWEEDALYNIEQFLNRSGIVSISEKFLRDGGIKDLLNPQKRIAG